MKTRILAAVALLPILLVIVLVLPTIFTAILFGLASSIAAYELLWGTGFVKHVRLIAYAALMAFLVALWGNLGGGYVWALLGVLVMVVLLFAEIMISDMKLPFDKAIVCLAAGILIPFLLTALVRIHSGAHGKFYIMIPFILAFISDSGAYFVGCAIGKHKMAPVISPKKSWEGFFGGLVTAILGMLLYGWIVGKFFQFEVNYLYAAAYGLVGALGGVFGDLCFSVIKRQTGIKDYGNLIPGHGGALDRFDSIIVVAPIVELLLRWIPVVVK